MIGKVWIERVEQEIEALIVRMQTRQHERAMEVLMVASEKGLRSILDEYHDSEFRHPDVRQDAAYEARLAIARQASITTMENRSAAESWLSEPSAPLGGQAPTALLYSDEGLVQVLRALVAIEHGLPP